MRPHPMLAITSATVLLGVAGTIGAANLSGKSTRLAHNVLKSTHALVTGRGHEPLPRLPRAAPAIVVGVYRTTPLPYLFSHPDRQLQPTTTVPVRARSNPAAARLSGKWLLLRQCESGDNYTENSGNGYYGAYQFAATTWWALGFSGLPSSATPSMQDAAATKLQRVDGWSAWPVCSQAIGV